LQAVRLAVQFVEAFGGSGPDMKHEVEAHHHAHKTGHSWFDLVVPSCALFISLVSLGLAILDGRTMGRMADANARLVQANSWPFLQWTTSNQTETGVPLIRLGVVNAGVGPAKVETFEVFWNGHPVRNSRELLSKCCGWHEGMLPTVASAKGTPEQQAAVMQEASKIGMKSSDIAPAVIEAHSAEYFITLPLSEGMAPLFHALNAARLKVEYRICYCSVFDECWLSNLRTMTPKVVANCPEPKVPYGN
jgi:hypothetical protein